MRLLPILLIAAMMLATGLWWWDARSGRQGALAEPPTDRRFTPKSAPQRLRDAIDDRDRSRRSHRFATLWNDMTAADLGALAPELLAHEAASPFQNDWFEFLERWGALDPDAALQFTQDHGGSRGDDWRRSIIRGWANVDPAAAAQWWLTGPSTDREGLGTLIASRWTRVDWKSAVDWLSAQVPAHEQPALAPAIALELASRQPDIARSMVEACRARPTPPTPLEISLYHQLARTMPLDWLSTLRDSMPSDKLMVERVGQEPASNFSAEAAKGWFLWMLEPPQLFNSIHYYLIAPGEGTSPTLVNGLNHAKNSFQAWVDGDPEEASRWVAAQFNSALRDAAAGFLALSIAKEDPEAATAWAQSILSLQERTDIYRQWVEKGYPTTPAFERRMLSESADRASRAAPPEPEN